ncbi:response regulator transcription factor [Paenibacillus solani]|uniref:response regulator transcription factor n=1 Tax=Paenibacillus solani TaxID=1705565 RepID=UPI003D2C7723
MNWTAGKEEGPGLSSIWREKGIDLHMKLLIAEDEISVREGMVRLIDWESHGIVICGEAGNGSEALSMMESCCPDILLTDIRMPHMDGLELIEAAKSRGMKFRPIILSGYNEFNYATQALRLGAEDFILKPCRPEEILRTVLEAKKVAEFQEARESRLKERDLSWNRNIPLMKSQVLSQWTRYPAVPLEDRGRLMQELQMHIRNAGIQVGLIRVDTSRIPLDERDVVLLRYAAANIVKETLDSVYGGCIEAFQEGDDLLWVASTAEGSRGSVNPASISGPSQEGLEPHIRVLQGNLEKYLKMTVSIALGSWKASINQAHDSYQESVQAMESRFFKGRGGVFFYSGKERKEGAGSEAGVASSSILDNERFETCEREMLDYLRLGSFEQALDHLDAWLDMFKTQSHYSKQEVNLRATTFMISLQGIAKEHRIGAFEWKNRLVNSMEQLPQVETLEELATIVKKMMQHLVEACSSNRTLHRTVQSVLELIKEKYNTNLTLEAVAREAYISNTYLSSLFKQELGVNFLDYLHQYRIEKSKELLRQNLKIYAVARLVGYQEERHFSSTFKKWTGVTPSQYKLSIH